MDYLNPNPKDRTKQNIETRIANRLRSIFAAIGNIVSDFYLESGIYFVGGFNALLIAWDIFTVMLLDGQPMGYAITAAIFAFIATEGLAVYLVGAAAKTGNQKLWAASWVFAGFFTYAHYMTLPEEPTIMSYVSLAIPSFVVIGYWARTLKTDIESKGKRDERHQESEIARKRQIEDEARQIEAQKLVHQMNLEKEKLAINERVRLAKIEAQNRVITEGQTQGHLETKTQGQTVESSQMAPSLALANESRQSKKAARQNTIINLVRVEPNIKPTELTRRLNDLGHETSVSTVKRDLRVLNGSVK